MQIVRNTGKVLLILGILMLIAGLICGFTIGTLATPVLLWSSIPVNALGVTLMRLRV